MQFECTNVAAGLGSNFASVQLTMVSDVPNMTGMLGSSTLNLQVTLEEARTYTVGERYEVTITPVTE